MPGKSPDQIVEAARADLDRQEQRLSDARINAREPHGPLGRIIANATIRYREMVAYDTEEHLGMIEDIREAKSP